VGWSRALKNGQVNIFWVIWPLSMGSWEHSRMETKTCCSAIWKWQEGPDLWWDAQVSSRVGRTEPYRLSGQSPSPKTTPQMH